MSVHFLRELEQIKSSLLALCVLVEEQVRDAVCALLDRDADLAGAVEHRDRTIDQREIEIEEECLKTLALYQPVAADLRFLVAVLKINNDLERIGDLAVNIAHKAGALTELPTFEIPFDIETMSRKVESMLHDSLDALVNQDARAAQQVCARDAAVNAMKRQIRLGAEELIRGNPDDVSPVMRVVGVARNLERIADCATNIAEDVLYLVEGKVVRHEGP